jgi:bacterioferritin
MEQEIIQLYHDATLYCTRIGDREHQRFFEELLGEEREHAAELQGWIDELGGARAQGSSLPTY